MPDDMTQGQLIRLQAAQMLAHQFRDHADANALVDATLVLAKAIETGEPRTEATE